MKSPATSTIDLWVPPVALQSLPLHLDGSKGINRAAISHNSIDAHNDIEAIRLFLAEYSDSPQTRRAYAKELERLLMWCVKQQQKPLSSLNRQDFMAYEEFLANPTPADVWCGPKTQQRLAPGWRPFVGPLSASARRTSLVIINSFLNYLVDASYLQANPLALMRQRRRRAQQAAAVEQDVWRRTFDSEQWQAILDVLTPSSQRRYSAAERDTERARFIVALLYFLALRLEELAGHSMGDFVERRGSWYFNVVGKGNKSAYLPVNSGMLDALKRYRTYHNLSPLPAPNETTPLASDLDAKQRLSSRALHNVIKRLLATSADRLETSHPQKATLLRNASAHWFRHTSITHMTAAGIPLAQVRANARHSKSDTTLLYVHTDDEARQQEMEKLSWK